MNVEVHDFYCSFKDVWFEVEGKQYRMDYNSNRHQYVLYRSRGNHWGHEGIPLFTVTKAKGEAIMDFLKAVRDDIEEQEWFEREHTAKLLGRMDEDPGILTKEISSPDTKKNSELCSAADQEDPDEYALLPVNGTDWSDQEIFDRIIRVMKRLDKGKGVRYDTILELLEDRFDLVEPEDQVDELIDQGILEDNRGFLTLKKDFFSEYGQMREEAKVDLA